MVTTVSEVSLREGSEDAWDDLMRERLEAVKSRPGWISGQVLKPAEGSGTKRIVIGTWESREAWASWHHDPDFRKAREQMDQLEVGSRQQWWHQITVAAANEGSPAALDEASR